MKQVKQLNGSWIVGAQITSHQEKVISFNTRNLNHCTKQKSQMGNSSLLRVLEQLLDIARCHMAWNPCRSDMCYMFQRQISSFFINHSWTMWMYVPNNERGYNCIPEGHPLHYQNTKIGKITFLQYGTH